MKNIRNEVYRNKTLPDLIEYLSERLYNPVLLETTEFELIAYSGDYQLLDNVRKNTILGKKAPSYIIDCLMEEKIVEKIESSSDPIRLPSIERIDFTARVAFCVRVKNKPVAYLWVQEAQQRLVNADFEVIANIGRKIANLMQQDRIPSHSNEHRIFKKLLDGHFTSEQLFLLEAEMAGINIPTEYVVLIFYNPNTNVLKNLLKIVHSYCLYENPMSFYIEKENCLTVILGNNETNKRCIFTIADRLVQIVLQPDKHTDIHVGISTKSTNLLDARRHYLEAIDVINIRKVFAMKNIPYFYSKLGIYRLLSVFQEKYTNEGYVNEHICTLNKYDIKNHTELVSTLEAYISCNCKGKETAEALFIHPNTLSYRLKKIIELTDIDFDDINQRTILYIDLLLQRYESISNN